MQDGFVALRTCGAYSIGEFDLPISVPLVAWADRYQLALHFFHPEIARDLVQF